MKAELERVYNIPAKKNRKKSSIQNNFESVPSVDASDARVHFAKTGAAVVEYSILKLADI